MNRNHPLWRELHTKPFRGSARLSILIAKEAPVALVIRRQPTKLYTFFRWDLQTNELISGGSYKGVFWARGCDISWDGRFWGFCAAYTRSGDLLVAQRGYLLRYELPGIRDGKPTFWQDLNLV